jgi:hypothetical protein
MFVFSCRNSLATDECQSLGTVSIDGEVPAIAECLPKLDLTVVGNADGDDILPLEIIGGTSPRVAGAGASAQGVPGERLRYRDTDVSVGLA